jgi:hypothetical protein
MLIEDKPNQNAEWITLLLISGGYSFNPLFEVY